MTGSPLADMRAALTVRSGVLGAVRDFFLERDFIEVETPVRVPVPAMEEHIDALPAGGQFLRTSPELHMKRMLAAGYPRLFQMGPCFRSGERGDRHNPEFTMLEWYRADANYLDVLADTQALIVAVATRVAGTTGLTYRGRRIDLAPRWEQRTVREAFTRFAGWDPVTAYDPDRFDLDLTLRVEPELPFDRPCVLMDYPAEAAALARLKPGHPAVAERWELYIGGLELANAFSELTDAGEQRRRFEYWARRRRDRGAETYPLDEDFLQALADGMPPSAGVAMGIDRLVMLLADATSIDQVRLFCDPA